MTPVITVNGLQKSYGNVPAVRGIDFYVESGKLFAFLGPNGAGKSTTIDILCTLLQPDAGEISVAGYRVGTEDQKIRESIGVVYQDPMLDHFLTIRENLQIRGGFYGLRGDELTQAIKQTAEITGVGDLLDRRYGKLSGGQKRRCDISRALIHTPKILFLDEPTTGLDPQTRSNVWQTIRNMQQHMGMTIFLTTHYMEEAAGADYVIVLDEGLIAAKGTPQQLKDTYSKDQLYLEYTKSAPLLAVLQRRKIAYTQQSQRVSIPLANTLDAFSILEDCHEVITGFEVIRGTLDDAFIKITGKELDE